MPTATTPAPLDLATWQTRAACKGLDAAMFFPIERGDPAIAAKEVCASCPVLTTCLEAAVDRNEPVGIWGGAGEAERRYLRRLALTRPHPGPDPIDGCSCPWCTEVLRHLDQLASGDWTGSGSERAPVSVRIGPGARHARRASYAKGCRCHGCRWSSSARGVWISAVGLDTGDWWTCWALEATDYDDARALADLAAWELLAALVDALLSLSPTAGRWSRARIDEAVEAERIRRSAMRGSLPAMATAA